MPAADDVQALLVRGDVTVKGRLPWSSNATFLVEVALDRARTHAVYKPARGERPLWDFPPRLYRREIAAWALSDALGWDLVPLTVEREGPLGEGSLQQFIDADFEQHYFTLRERDAHLTRLRRIAVFDLVANNADRKAGHCLLGLDGKVYAIDNGLCFHAEPKLRTVIWDFAGEPMPSDIVEDVRRFVSGRFPAALRALLSADERGALLVRARAVVAQARFPEERGGRCYPWPLV